MVTSIRLPGFPDSIIWETSYRWDTTIKKKDGLSLGVEFEFVCEILANSGRVHHPHIIDSFSTS